jgi:hypothetical protein
MADVRASVDAGERVRWYHSIEDLDDGRVQLDIRRNGIRMYHVEFEGRPSAHERAAAFVLTMAGRMVNDAEYKSVERDELVSIFNMASRAAFQAIDGLSPGR